MQTALDESGSCRLEFEKSCCKKLTASKFAIRDIRERLAIELFDEHARNRIGDEVAAAKVALGNGTAKQSMNRDLPDPNPKDPNNPALWSRARLPKKWLLIINQLTGKEMSRDTLTERMKDIYPAHPKREGHEVRLLLSSLPAGYDDSK